nr:UDP-2,3-diacylglucosamine diphosphatase LpxI [Hyphomonas sp. Mor2]
MAPLGIIAGLGELPVQVAEAATARGQGVYVLRLKGFEEAGLEQFPGEVSGIAEIGKAIKAFRQAGCEQICFAGVVKRPDFKALKPDMKGMSLLPKAISAARKGDDALLTFMIKVFEDEGFEIVGANEAAGNLQAPEGLLAGPEPTDVQIEDLKKAAYVALEIGRMDIGQGAIVANGLVLCVEAQEGTDEMLKRCADLPTEIRGSSHERLGVLVKRPKPQQERRIDLPTLGKKTLDGASAAGLAGIGYEAGGALIVDVETVKAHAEALGLFLYGFPQDWDT